MEDKELSFLKAMMHLQDIGVNEVRVEYSGGGDSGGIEDTSFYHRNSNDIGVNGDTLNDKVDPAIKTIIEDAAYLKLNEIEDWWNNDGGYGSMTINVPSGEYTINNNIRITDYEVYNHDGSLNPNS